MNFSVTGTHVVRNVSPMAASWSIGVFGPGLGWGFGGGGGAVVDEAGVVGRDADLGSPTGVPVGCKYPSSSLCLRELVRSVLCFLRGESLMMVLSILSGPFGQCGNPSHWHSRFRRYFLHGSPASR
jgi:hypothetical protein